MKAKNKIVSLRTLKARLEKDRQQGKKIVFTNGCFDILHAIFLYLHKLMRFGFLPKQVLQHISPMIYHPPLCTCYMMWNETFPIVLELVAIVFAGKKWH